MSGLDIVTGEFTRQAETFDAWAQKTDEAAGTRFRAALGAAAAGALLDVACGPGVVTAALAPHAGSVTALDATPAMLDRARARCAGLGNVGFVAGDAQHLPFADARFDGVVSRLAVHHFAEAGRAIAEMARVLKPGGTLVLADVVVSEDKADADLQNAIEKLRDPSHVAMLPETRLVGLVAAAGLAVTATESWERAREFEEWLGIVNDETRGGPLRVVVGALIAAGSDAGMGLRVAGERIVFLHHWCLVVAHKPAA